MAIALTGPAAMAPWGSSAPPSPPQPAAPSARTHAPQNSCRRVTPPSGVPSVPGSDVSFSFMTVLRLLVVWPVLEVPPATLEQATIFPPRANQHPHPRRSPLAAAVGASTDARQRR